MVAADPAGATEEPSADHILAALGPTPTTVETVRAVRDLGRLSGRAGIFEPRTVAVVRNFTVEPVEPFLKLAAYRRRLSLTVNYSGYQPAPGPELEALVGGDTDVVLIALRLEQLAPILAGEFLADAGESRSEAATAVVETVESLIHWVRALSQAAVLVHNFAMPPAPAGGIGDAQQADGQVNLIRAMNRRLARIAERTDHCYIVDVDHALADLGLRNCFDGRGDRVSGAPLTVGACRTLGDVQARHIRALSGPAYKCLVIDCDNTLWGGVIGEDGLAGISLSDTGPGARYRELHRQLLNLKQRGTVLAICSRNEERDVLEVFAKHPDSLLRVDDFASMRIDWGDKVEHLVSIADELGFGLRHLVFIDDDPVQCDAVRVRLPEVRVLRYPDDLPPSGRIDDLELFDTLVVTDEDRNRTGMYQAQKLREQSNHEIPDAGTYLRSLALIATVGYARPEHLGRLAQLIQRTNQFNLTVRRYQVGELTRMIDDGSARVLWLHMEDRFGTYGMVGCAILRVDGSQASVDTLLLSCRVLGRGAETVLVRRAVAEAAAAGAAVVMGEYRPADRNGQVADLYGRLGFSGPTEHDGGTRWEWPVSRGLPPVPDWIRVEESQEASRC